MKTQPACRNCQHHSGSRTISTCKLRGLRVRADHLCDEFDFKNGGQKALTEDDLESLQTLAPVTADGLSAWAKRNANR
jgi:hypothetical protein